MKQVAKDRKANLLTSRRAIMKNMKICYLLLIALIPLVCLSTASAGKLGTSYIVSEDGSVVKDYIYDELSPDITLDVPENDNCENAETVFSMPGEGYNNVRTVVVYSTLEATFDGSGLCQTEPNIWYIYTADVTAEVTVSTDDNLGDPQDELTYDSYLAVYEGSTCPPSSVIACNDDYEEGKDYSKITFMATAGNQYLIEVGGIDKGGRDATGLGELIVIARPIHDVRLWSLTSPRPGKLLDTEDVGFSDIKAYIFNPGANTERIDVTAYDPDGDYSNSYDNLVITPNEFIEIHLVNPTGPYTFPSETCVDGNLTLETHLDRDVVPGNNTFSTAFRRTRSITQSYENYSNERPGGGSWTYHHNSVIAKEYVAEGNEEIVYIGARVWSGDYGIWLGNGATRYFDPIKLSLFIDGNNDGYPDIEPIFEAFAKPAGMPNDWCYAVLPCGITITEGQHFWVGWSDYQHDRWGHFLAFDNIPNDRDIWCRNQYKEWVQEDGTGRYYLGAWATDSDAISTSNNSDGASGIPETFELSHNYPNPFNAQTSIEFALPQAGEVELTVYNMLGQEIDVLVLGTMEAGYHSVIWDASDVSTGVYFYKINAGEFSKTQKMLLLK